MAINHFVHDKQTEIDTLSKTVETLDLKAIVCKHWEQGGDDVTNLVR